MDYMATMQAMEPMRLPDQPYYGTQLFSYTPYGLSAPPPYTPCPPTTCYIPCQDPVTSDPAAEAALQTVEGLGPNPTAPIRLRASRLGRVLRLTVPTSTPGVERGPAHFCAVVAETVAVATGEPPCLVIPVPQWPEAPQGASVEITFATLAAASHVVALIRAGRFTINGVLPHPTWVPMRLRLHITNLPLTATRRELLAWAVATFDPDTISAIDVPGPADAATTPRSATAPLTPAAAWTADMWGAPAPAPGPAPAFPAPALPECDDDSSSEDDHHAPGLGPAPAPASAPAPAFPVPMLALPPAPAAGPGCDCNCNPFCLGLPSPTSPLTPAVLPTPRTAAARNEAAFSAHRGFMFVEFVTQEAAAIALAAIGNLGPEGMPPHATTQPHASWSTARGDTPISELVRQATIYVKNIPHIPNLERAFRDLFGRIGPINYASLPRGTRHRFGFVEYRHPVTGEPDPDAARRAIALLNGRAFYGSVLLLQPKSSNTPSV